MPLGHGGIIQPSTAALLGLVAKAIGVAPRNVTLMAGATSRIKRLKIDGHPPALAAALEKICAVG